MSDFRAVIRARLAALVAGQAAPADLIGAESVWDISWPLAPLTGPDAVMNRLIEPLRAAFTGLHRRDLLFIGGDNIRKDGGTWVACVTHYVGTFEAPLFGIRPSGHLAFLRAGEFYRIDGGRITAARIILDLPDLMRQTGRMPLPSLGTEITFPAPATQDGLCPATGDGAASLDIVQRMLGALHAYDPETKASAGQTGAGGTWAEDMLWYGPAGIGSNYRWDGFVRDHRDAFLTAFPDRKGGNHYCRIGDGAYAAVSGWPSMTMTFRADYLGVPATGQALTLRVMDFYRTAAGRIAENWVLLDYGDLFQQMGVDLIARSRAMA